MFSPGIKAEFSTFTSRITNARKRFHSTLLKIFIIVIVIYFPISRDPKFRTDWLVNELYCYTIFKGIKKNYEKEAFINSQILYFLRRILIY